jgi:hypothetical protein
MPSRDAGAPRRSRVRRILIIVAAQIVVVGALLVAGELVVRWFDPAAGAYLFANTPGTGN